MKHPKIYTTLLFSILAIHLGGCQEKDTKPSANPTKKEVSVQTNIRSFKATQEDIDDIQQLDQFNDDFSTTTQGIYNELVQLKQQNILREDYILQRKYEQARAAVNMLDDLDLKTDQGHYIQGLLNQYWQQQAAFLKSKTQMTNEHPTPANIQILTQAEQQLIAWKKQSTT
ncbi:hypothetical protein [Acinetobacter nectaris]|uniref:hypothetical protein n=1 Tax=Acinetobacter nectaris TaxID=1219382 RepID=UPI001F46ACBC|nr:hypothetical protein [Acinetobacter nectaris]MCF9045473.1 hypothetical protein [Acinetobacter nectaris]